MPEGMGYQTGGYHKPKGHPEDGAITGMSQTAPPASVGTANGPNVTPTK